MSAESNMVSPASRQTSARRVASFTSLGPKPLKKGLLPPKVPVPSVRTGILSPDRPRMRYSMGVIATSQSRRDHRRGEGRRQKAADATHQGACVRCPCIYSDFILVPSAFDSLRLGLG